MGNASGGVELESRSGSVKGKQGYLIASRVGAVRVKV
jgi:hypothetical protein